MIDTLIDLMTKISKRRVRSWNIAPIAVWVFLAIGVLPAQEPTDTNYDEKKVPIYSLPPLLPKGSETKTNSERIAFWNLFTVRRRTRPCSLARRS